MRVQLILLAGGRSVRFRSETPKLLYPFMGVPLFLHPIHRARDLVESGVVVCNEENREPLKRAYEEWKEFLSLPEMRFVLQGKGKGTLVAALSGARECSSDWVLILSGDVPLVETSTLSRLVETGAPSVLGFRTDDPTGYGRMVKRGARVRIVEEKDASPEEKGVNLVNGGVYLLERHRLIELGESVEPSPSTGEYYLPEVVNRTEGVRVVECPEEELLGVNDKWQLSQVEAVGMRKFMRKLAVEKGVYFADPSSTRVDVTVRFEGECTVLPGTLLRGKTVVGAGVVVGPNSYVEDSNLGEHSVVAASWVEGSEVGPRCRVGPFAHLRKGTVLEAEVRVGNFVETKKAHLHEGVKASHLTYLGDCEVGKNTNVGAGTITCNYDGFKKHFTRIGENAFIGSDTIIVAPCEIGDGAITAAGSVITRPVPPDSLGIARAKQENKEKWAKIWRARKKRGS